MEEATTDEAVTRAISALDASIWDHAEAAEGAARIYLDAGRVLDAWERLMAGGRRLEGSLDFARASDLYHAAAALPGLDDEVVDRALVREARARAFQPRASSLRTAAWLHLLDRARTRGDVHAHARALVHLSSCDLEEPPDEPFLEQAAALGGDGWSARAQAILQLRAGDYDAAIECNQRAVAHARRSGDRYLEAVALDGIGNALGFLGRIEEFIRLLRQSVAINEEDGDVRAAMFARCNIVEMLLQQLQAPRAVPEVAALRKLVPSDERGEWNAIVTVIDARVQGSLGQVGAAAELASQAVGPFIEGGSTMSDCVMLLTCVEIALDAGQLDRARRLAPVAIATSARVGISVFELQASWLQLRLRAIDEALTPGEVLAEAGPMLAGDPWTASAVAWHIGWRAVAVGDLETARVATGGVGDVHDEDLLIQAYGSSSAAIVALLDGDDRPMRLVRRTWEAAGMQLEVLRCEAVLAMAAEAAGDRDAPAQLVRIRSRMESLGAVVDADVLAARTGPGASGGGHQLEAMPLLQGLPPAALERLRAVSHPMRIDAGDETFVGGNDVLLVQSGLLRIDLPEPGGVLTLHGGGSIAPAGGEPGSDVVASAVAGVVGWRVAAAEFDAWMESLDPALRGGLRSAIDSRAGVIGRTVDTRSPVATRIVRLLLRLVDSFGRDDAASGNRVADTGLTQDDLAVLAATSRKTATLCMSELRGAQLADARRGRVVIIDRGGCLRRIDGAAGEAD